MISVVDACTPPYDHETRMSRFHEGCFVRLWGQLTCQIQTSQEWELISCYMNTIYMYLHVMSILLISLPFATPPYPCKYMMVELSQRDLPSWLLSTFQGDGKTDTEYLGQMLSWVRGRGGVCGPKKGCISDQVDGTPEAVVVSDVLTAWSCFYVWFVFKSIHIRHLCDLTSLTIVWVWRSSIV